MTCASTSHELAAGIRHDRSFGATLSQIRRADSAVIAANIAPPATMSRKSNRPSTRIEMSLNCPSTDGVLNDQVARIPSVGFQSSRFLPRNAL